MSTTSTLLRTPWARPGSWALAAVAGVALQLLQPALWRIQVYAGCGLGAAGLWLACWSMAWHWRRSPQSRWRWVLWAMGWAAWACMAFASAGLQALQQQAQRLAPDLEGVDLQVHAVVDAMPQRTAQGWRLRLAVLHAQRPRPEGGLVDAELPQLLEVMWYAPRTALAGAQEAVSSEALPAVLAGERWQWTLRLKAPHGARNPHGFDWELWLWEQGVGATGYVRTGPGLPPPERLAAAGMARPVEQLRQHVRDAIVARAEAQPQGNAHARALGVVAALVTGDQRAIATEDWEVFRRTGVAHLVSISGLHITMFAWLATAAMGWLWRRSQRLCLWWPAPQAALWAGVLLAASYALFSGWGLPAQRTVGMLAVVAWLRSGGWQWPWHAVWAVTLAVLALWDPWALCQAGFWLSFVAVGVLLASGTAAPSQGLWGELRKLAREQWLVVVALSPLSLLFFGQVSLAGILANLLAIPWITLVVTPLAMLGVVWPPLWEAAAFCVQSMLWLLQAMAAWPWASLARPQAPWWAALAAMAGGVLLAMPWPRAWRLLALSLLWPALCWQTPRPAHGMFDLLALDVGQGSAILLRTARHSLLFDAGPAWYGGDAGARAVLPLLQAWGERLDVLLLSHSDMDHVGGADSVLAAQPWVDLRGAGAADLASAQHKPWQPCVAGQQWEWDGVLWQVLYPPAGGAVQGNPSSCVLRVQAANGAAALLTGDIEAPQEAALLRSGQRLTADLLLAPHHGSRTSSSPAFVAAVAPRTVVVQAGYRNRFGHPAPQVVQRYAGLGVAVVATPQCGAAYWQAEAAQTVDCERQRHRHYWSAATAP
ncbi:DNA internalization-related competence protein ComEC/Rec2 [Comamonas sp. GB3 AK4-5]|uniref:DNA internalization-related competence protein ComEC/Rec2 n=1 Tax=Comamonas sp. GB3 AK4-5 TaxID=3231487 RepID=UPI00351DE0FA